MNLYFYKPTSPGVRNRVSIKHKLSKIRYDKNLYKIIKYNAGRNNLGNITVRHKGGRLKRKYRIIDFYRNKHDIYGKVIQFEYDPYRNSLIAMIIYYDGETKYIISPKNIKIGDVIISGFDNIPVTNGNSLLIKNIPEGTKLHCLESIPGSGAKYIRSAGSYGTLISKNDKFAYIMLKSGKLKNFNLNCRATVGEVGNEEINLKNRGKAGISRLMGIRPTVRGVAMNPVDHPHGGGEGKTSGGRDPVTPWGICTKGYKTRRK